MPKKKNYLVHHDAHEEHTDDHDHLSMTGAYLQNVQNFASIDIILKYAHKESNEGNGQGKNDDRVSKLGGGFLSDKQRNMCHKENL